MDLGLLLDLVNVDVGNIGFVAVDDTGKLLEGRALGFDVHEEDEGELAGNPALLFQLSVRAPFVSVGVLGKKRKEKLTV